MHASQSLGLYALAERSPTILSIDISTTTCAGYPYKMCGKIRSSERDDREADAGAAGEDGAGARSADESAVDRGGKLLRALKKGTWAENLGGSRSGAELLTLSYSDDNGHVS